jgi:hypothetical protein
MHGANGWQPDDKVELKIKNYETSDALSRQPSLILFSLDGESPLVIKFIRVLSGAWAVYALFILAVVVRNFVGFVSNPYSGRAPFFVAVIMFVVVGTLSISIPASLSYLLAVRRHWEVALVIAALSCIGFPIGTTLGVVTIVALMLRGVRLAFTPTI